MKLICDTDFRGSQESQYKKYLNAIDAAVSNGVIYREEGDLIQAFISECNAQNRIVNVRKYINANAIIIFRQYLPDYRECTTQSVYLAIEKYRSTSGHADSYQSGNLIMVKKFLLWLSENGYNSLLDSAKILKIKIKKPNATKTDEDILTGDELENMFKSMRSLRNRALIEVLYDSMGRIGEVVMLKWNQIAFHDNYATVTVESKTGNPRKIPLHISHLVLRQWMNQYPTGMSPDKYVFPGRVSDPYKYLSYTGALDIIRKAAKSAGIKKNVTPHIFRHTRITDLMRMGVPEQTIKMLAWGTVTTDMLRVYAHLTPTDAENDLNRIMGVEKVDPVAALSDVATPVQCKGCGIVNAKSNKFCGSCGFALSDEVKNRYDHTVDDLQRDPQYHKAVQAALAALKIENGA